MFFNISLHNFKYLLIELAKRKEVKAPQKTEEFNKIELQRLKTTISRESSKLKFPKR